MSQVPLSALDALWPKAIIRPDLPLSAEDAKRIRAAMRSVARNPIVTGHDMEITYATPATTPIYDRLADEYGWVA